MIAPGRFVLAAVLLFGAAFAIVTPPFQVPDEPAHFYRAYRMSEGRLDLLPTSGRVGAPLPVSVHRIGDLFGPLTFHPERKTSPRAILAALRIPLAPERRELVFFPNSLQYTFVPYIPQAIGVAAGRLLGAPPLALLYLARLANLLCGALAVAFAVRRLPAFAWLAAMVALTPMCLSLFASASVDVTTIASSFLLVSTVARLAWGRERAARGDLLLLAAASAVLCASKPPYLPLALLVLLIPVARFPRGRRAGFLPIHFGLSLLAASWPLAISRVMRYGRLEAGVDAGRQIHDSLLHPFHLLRLVIEDYAVHALRYLSQIVGRLGWLDTQLPAPLLAAYLAVLLALVFLDASPRVEVRLWQRGIAAGAVLVGMILISAAEYAIWTPYGADYIEGVQGRYFLPLVLPASWIFHRRSWAGRIGPRRLGMALGAFSVLSWGIALRALVGRYYGV
ncbi:MAG TPA: DUF2142 domain-containing protein [Thermoanaerobaculia bacterium]|nr:DUF2142 domain-containing protein [Thermoanaerobaculia bacterium]